MPVSAKVAVVPRRVGALFNFLTARKRGINIGIGANQDSATIPLNAAVAIIQNELVLSLFAIFPAVAIVAATITRDHECTMAELFFARPIREPSYVLGRFAGGLAFAVLPSLAGVLGGFISLTAPGIDPIRLGPFAAAPWWFVVYAVAVPNTIVAAALVFGNHRQSERIEQILEVERHERDRRHERGQEHERTEMMADRMARGKLRDPRTI